MSLMVCYVKSTENHKLVVMVYLQIVFALTSVCIAGIAWVMWRIYKRHRLPGVNWWAYGSGAIALTTLLSAISEYVGEWARAVIAHVLLVGGFGAIWMGTQLFFGRKLGRWCFIAFDCFLIILCIVFFWYWLINPAYQLRLAMGCVLLLLISLAISQTFFAFRVGQRAVTAAGIYYSAFAFINGLRTVHILLFPEPDAYFLSGMSAKILMSLMIPILLAAMTAQLFILRHEIYFSSEREE